TTDAALAIRALRSATTSSLTALSISTLKKRNPPAGDGGGYLSAFAQLTNHRLGRILSVDSHAPAVFDSYLWPSTALNLLRGWASAPPRLRRVPFASAPAVFDSYFVLGTRS